MRVWPWLLALCLLAAPARSSDAAIRDERASTLGAARHPCTTLPLSHRPELPVGYAALACIVPAVFTSAPIDRRVDIVVSHVAPRDHVAPILLTCMSRGPPSTPAR